MDCSCYNPRDENPKHFKTSRPAALPVLHPWINDQATAAKKNCAILFTGGIDSTVLACLAREFKPVLYFAEIIAPACAGYNRHSIRHCRLLAEKLGLNFYPVRVTRSSFRKQSRELQKLASGPSTSEYLPATVYLFSLINRQGCTDVFSGIGADDVLTGTRPQIINYATQVRPQALKNHQLAAQRHNLKFHAPFLNPAFIRGAIALPLHARITKQPLLDILTAYPEVYPLMAGRPRTDSLIPEDFFLRQTDADAPVLKNASTC